jgi:hypothetical protein
MQTLSQTPHTHGSKACPTLQPINNAFESFIIKIVPTNIDFHQNIKA